MTTIGHDFRMEGGTLRRALAHVRAWLAALAAHRKATTRRRATLVHLADLQDWQLDDIGVTRAEVEQALGQAGIRRDPASLFERR